MKGDFSRLTFAEKNHYRRVLMQQGRVEIDADSNEQVAIDDHIAATTTYDVVGQSGYPNVNVPGTTTPIGGFALGFSPISGPAKDLSISTGRMYVDGLLVENDTAGATLLHQPDLPGISLADLAAVAANGVYVVYLDVWERLMTALDNPEIRETALGGPDTSARSKVVWQVKLGYAEPLPTAGSTVPTCATVPDTWRPTTANQGTLTAMPGAAVSTTPCILPPTAGYQLLENQLYRVEIHAGGTAGTATFKWSRENGSVVVGVVPPTGAGPILGPGLTVTGLQSDSTVGINAGDWVELSDDHSELVEGHGELLQVHTVSGTTVTTTTASTAGVDPTLNPKLRRWDQTGTGLNLGLPTTPGTPVTLEGGVQVVFSEGTYQPGDYWLIPARTATSVQQGSLEWPVDDMGNPLALPPRGIRHHYAKLGLVQLANGVFSGIGNSTTPLDCRLPFLPLTELNPAQSLSPCTIVVTPGPGWQQPILALFQNAKTPVNAEICFPVGDFSLNTPLAIANAGHLKFIGAGWGTRLLGAKGEAGPASVLTFDDCLSVSVCDLYAETSIVSRSGGIKATLAFSDCGEVAVDNVWARCGSAVGVRGAACVMITTGVVKPRGTADTSTIGPGSARVRSCRLWVGEMQVGIELVNQTRATIEDNEIAVDPKVPTTTTASRLADPIYLSAARSYLIAGATLTPAPKAAAPVERQERVEPESPRATTSLEEPDSAGSAPAGPAPAGPAPAGPAPAGPAPAGRVVASSQVESAIHPNLQVTVGTQALSFTTNPALQPTWQTFLDANAPKEIATQNDALRYVKKAATSILLNSELRTGLSGFSTVIGILNRHVPLAGRGIVAGGQDNTISDLRIMNNSISGVLMGISVGVSHRASSTEARNKQRAPDHIQTVRIIGNTIACMTNDIAKAKARFGVFVGNVTSLEMEDNRLTQAPAGISASPFSDAIRVCGYLGAKAVIRHNHMTNFTMGIRVVALTGNGPGTPAEGTELNYFSPIRHGPLLLVADNLIEGASAVTTKIPPGPFTATTTNDKTNPPTPPPVPAPFIEANACVRINNSVVP